MDFVQYKCPCCGAALQFSPETLKLSCESCGNQYDLETLRQYEQDKEPGKEQDLSWEYQGETRAPGKRRMDFTSVRPVEPGLRRMKIR